MADGAAGVWQERGGHWQALAQQSSEDWQHAEAQASAAGIGDAPARDSGAAATLKSNRSSTANLI